MDLLLFLLLPSLLIPVIILFLLQQTGPTNEKKPLPPGPKGLPLIGNLHQLHGAHPHIRLRELSERYGPLMSLRLGSIPALVVSSAEMAKEVMKTHDLAFASRPPLVGMQKLSYGGYDIAFAPYGDYWREMRKTCVLHFFSSKRVQSFRYEREDEVKNMIRKIETLAEASREANLSELSMSLTAGSICRIAFGKKYEDDEGKCGKSKFHGLLNEAQAMMATLFMSDYLPWLGWVDMLSGMRTRLEKNFREFDKFYQEIIDEHLANISDTPKPKEEDITDVLLRLRKEQVFPTELTLDQIKAVLMNILLAGTDTSAAIIVWAMMEMTKNPRVMNMAKKEARDCITEEMDFINEEEVHRLPYLKAIVKETLRLHPVAPLLVPRQTTQRCEIGGYEIKPRTLVHINAWAIGRDPVSWENPDEFIPERFLGRNSKDFKGQDFEFIPFGAGRRICPGIHIGVATVELVLANLLRSFDWELPEGTTSEHIDEDVLPGITMQKKNPLCLVPRKNLM